MIVDLHAAIHKALSNDAILLELMGLTGADPLTKAKRFQKRARPQELIVENLPLISFYANPSGGLDPRNFMTYQAVFVFDAYTQDDVSLAQNIAKHITNLFHAEISPFEEVENFETLLVSQYESERDFPNSYTFTTVLRFTIALEK